MKRLFTFGCSFTLYHWPTWADIVAHQFDYFENWGKGGACNLYIFNAVNECVLKNNISKNDTVIIMWTNILRSSGYSDSQWKVGLDNDKFDTQGSLIKDLALINATRIILDHLKIKYYFLSFIPFFPPTLEITSEKIKRILNLYQDTIAKIRPSILTTVFNNNWNSRPLLPNDINQNFVKKKRFDNHASPIEHLEYLDKVLPELPIDNKTREWVNLVDNQVKQPCLGKDYYSPDYCPWATAWDESLWIYNNPVSRL